MGQVLPLSWFRGTLDPELEARWRDTARTAPSTAPRGPRMGRVPPAPMPTVVAQVAVTVPLDPYLSLKALARYSGLSVRKLRDLLTDPAHRLPCYQPGGKGGKQLVRRSEFDAWMTRYRRIGNPDLDRVVAEVLRDVGSAPKPRRAGAHNSLDTSRRVAV